MSETPRDDQPAPEDGRTDPTAPLPYPEQYSSPQFPPPPPAPPTAPLQQGGPPDGTPPPPALGGGPEGDPYAANPYESSPYGANPYEGNPYGGAPQPPYGAPQAPYGSPPPAYYQSAAPQSNTSALVLTIVSAIGTLSCCLPLPALILGIIALTKQSTDPAQSARLAKYGWVTFGVMVGLAVLAFFAVIAFGFVTSPTSVDYGY
jgi:hypothetical protein